MNLISLNIWGGHIKNPLLDFVCTHRDIDLFCFQEVYHDAKYKISTEKERNYALNIFSELQENLPEHQGFFRPVVDRVYGLALFVRKTIDILGEGEILIHENPHYPGRGPTHARNLQWVELIVNNKKYAILNIHGLWNGLGKSDTPERIAQSLRIKDFLETINIPKVMCGDFNLRPDTKSIKILEEGMDNLIEKHGIQSTRTVLYPKEEKFADYILTSPDIKVNDFFVLSDEVSDHAPLFLSFS
ncbi:MAG: endonuclease/exonuclease/phosphatase family protein [Gammaproteobacteria bacterium]|nr:endonuclease/exonuclease/phosphatase family protein [Gammaproteobacteria bacterium]